MISAILEATRSLGPDVDEPFPCVGATELFHAPDGERKREKEQREQHAKQLCARCPVKVDCAQIGRDLGEYGIWGGENEEERFAVAVRRTRTPPICGTEPGYQKHRKNKSAICDPCREAHKEVKKEEYRRAQLKKGKPAPKKREPPACGTYGAARRHERRGETKDPACKAAAKAYHAAKRKKRKAAA